MSCLVRCLGKDSKEKLVLILHEFRKNDPPFPRCHAAAKTNMVLDLRERT